VILIWWKVRSPAEQMNRCRSIPAQRSRTPLAMVAASVTSASERKASAAAERSELFTWKLRQSASERGGHHSGCEAFAGGASIV
jgi:hypothetical protein